MNFFGDLFKPEKSEVSDYELKPVPVPDNLDLLLRSFSNVTAQLMERRLQALEQGNKKLANNLAGQITGIKLAQTMVETFFYRD